MGLVPLKSGVAYSYGSVIGGSPVVGVGLMAPKKSSTFPTVPTVPSVPQCREKSNAIELLLLELLKRGHLVKLTPARNATVTAPEAVGSSASTPHGCGANRNGTGLDIERLRQPKAREEWFLRPREDDFDCVRVRRIIS